MEETIKSISNRKAEGPDQLPADLLKLILDEDRNGDRRIVEQLNAIVIAIGGAGAYRRSGNMPRS